MKNREYEEYGVTPIKNWKEIIDNMLEYNLQGRLVHANINGIHLYSDQITLDSAYMKLTDMAKHEYDYYDTNRDMIVKTLISQCCSDVIREEKFKQYVQAVITYSSSPIMLQIYDLVVHTAYSLTKGVHPYYKEKVVFADRINQFCPGRKAEVLTFVNNYIKDEYRDELSSLLTLDSKTK